MATTYTVKPGDTLSAIGKKFGVDWRKITGYRSGNPNLIYPGEVLTIPIDTAPAPQQQTTTQPQTTTSTPTMQQTVMDYQTAVKAARELSPDFSDIYKTYADLAQQIKTTTEEAAKRKEAQIPLVQNIYAKLAEDLARQEAEEKQTKETEKTTQVGTQAARAAAAGFSTIEGFKADELRNLAADYDRQISKIADKYRIDRERLAATEAQTIQDLQSQAEQLRATGMNDIANILDKQASLKSTEQQLINQQVTAILQSQDKSEANYWRSVYQDALLGIKEQQLQLEALKIQMGKQYEPKLITDALLSVKGKAILFDPNTATAKIVNLEDTAKPTTKTPKPTSKSSGGLSQIPGWAANKLFDIFSSPTSDSSANLR
jgi:ribosome-binding protein aMBF1 (putative translation factor)